MIFFLCCIVFSFSLPAVSDNGDEPRLVIRNNQLSDSGFGIYIGSRDEKVLIQGNTLTGHAEAIRLMGVKNENVVRKNRIADNLAGITVRDFYSHNEKGYVSHPVDPKDIKISANEFLNNEEGNILNLLEENGFTGEGSDQENQEGETATDGSSGDDTADEEPEGKADTEEEDKESATSTSSELQEAGESSSEDDASTTGNIEDTSMEEASEDPTMEDDVEETSEETETTEETSQSPGEAEDNTTETEETVEGVGGNQEETVPQEENGYTPNSGSPYLIAGATVVGLTTLLLVLKNSI